MDWLSRSDFVPQTLSRQSDKRLLSRGLAAAAWIQGPVSSGLQSESMRLAFLCHLNERKLCAATFPRRRGLAAEIWPRGCSLVSPNDQATCV